MTTNVIVGKPLPRFYIRRIVTMTGVMAYGAFRTEYRTKGGHLYGSYVMYSSRGSIARVMNFLTEKFG